MSVPGKPVACNYGLLWLIYGLLWCIAANFLGYLAFQAAHNLGLLSCDFGLLGYSGVVF